ASGLRKEAGRGRLVIERTAGKDYTTLAAIEEMRRLCQLHLEGRACGSARSGETDAAASPTPASTSSETEPIKRAQAAAEATVSALKESSSPTSTVSTPRKRRKARVIPIKSLLPTS